jgi:hypothetical protein
MKQTARMIKVPRTYSGGTGDDYQRARAGVARRRRTWIDVCGVVMARHIGPASVAVKFAQASQIGSLNLRVIHSTNVLVFPGVKRAEGRTR